MLSLVSFAGMTLDKCIVLRIGTLTGCPLCRESHPLCRLKNPTVISIWLLVGFHPATRCVQCTPADNTRKRVWQYIEKERKIRYWPLMCQFDNICLETRYRLLIIRLLHIIQMHSRLILSRTLIRLLLRPSVTLQPFIPPLPTLAWNITWCARSTLM